MIHVQPAAEPAGFNDAVRVPGLRAIAEMVGKTPAVARSGGRPYQQRHREAVQPDGKTNRVPVTCEDDLPSDEFPALWTEALDDLMDAYHKVCAYSCFRIHPVTGARSVDHMAPKSRAWDQVYEWDNYRLCSSLLNARKNNFGDVLDPFEVEDGWFVLELVGFQVLPADGLSEELKGRVRDTEDRLGLNGHRFRTSRERDVLNYESGVPFAVLQEESPFVAKELARQGRLRPEDA